MKSLPTNPVHPVKNPLLSDTTAHNQLRIPDFGFRIASLIL